MHRPLRWAGALTLAVLALTVLTAASRPAVPTAQIQASAALGTVVTATLSVDNTGQPAATAWLYEALEAPAGAAQSPPPDELRVPLPDEPGPLSPDLATALAAPGAEAEFIIYLADQADLSAAAALPDWNARGAAVVDTLRAHADKSQAALLADLQAAGYAPTPYWIVNAVAVRGGAALAQWAASQPGVALVAANHVHALDDPAALAGEAGELAQAAANSAAWGVEKIGAPQVWDDWGVRGAGIVVASIDTGAVYTHTALLENYRGYSPDGVDHNYNWFDGAGEPKRTAPVDQSGHGTHVMGTMVGQAAGDYTALGVAPAARWIAARGCTVVFCSDTALIASAQWLLAPTNLAGANPRPDLRPHIINNSWGKFGPDNWYIGYVQAWNAAGIFSAFANGNNGSNFTCGSSNSPAQYAEAFAVGATDSGDFIASFSSRGPTNDGRIKPDLSAPGVGVPSAWLNGGVHTLNGTSMATPHVSGAAALLWSANADLVGNLAATHAALTGSAVPLTSPQCGPSSTAVPNNVYGWGRLDARQAVLNARVDLPWLSVPLSATLPAGGTAEVTLTLDARQVPGPGVYTGRVVVNRSNTLESHDITFEVTAGGDTAQVTGHLTDLWSGGAVYGQVQVGDGPNVRTDTAGAFTVTLPYGSYTFTAGATGYLSATQGLDLNGPASPAFTLKPNLPHLVVTDEATYSATLAFGERYTGTVTLENEGTQPLSVTVAVPRLEWAVDAFGEPGSSLFDLSSAPALSLKDDEVYPQPLNLGFSIPIYGEMVSQIYLSSNGWISRQATSNSAQVANCMTGTGLPSGSLAAFWADLNPAAGGQVRAAALDAATFVISFEAVPLWQSASTPTPAPVYTFQIVLHASGDIDILFGDMGDLPTQWAIGAMASGGRSQNVACHQAPTELANRRFTLHNQPPATNWLTTSASSLLIAPGASAALEVVLHGSGYVPWLARPFEGQVLLTTNDPALPTVKLEAQASVTPPTEWLYLPLVRR